MYVSKKDRTRQASLYTTPNNMESFLTDLKKNVQCSLCNDTLTEPKMLKCFHTFCKPCIKRHAELIEEVNVFKCPECKSLTPLPELNSVEDLKPSVLHSRILKGLALAEGRKVCSVSDSHSPASWYCFDCDHSLCQECRDYHSFFMKDHKVVRLADLKKEDIEVIITRENHCQNHPNQRLELFCENCEAVICLTCLKDSHKGHVASSLDEFASRKKTVLSKHLQMIENLMSNDKEKQEHEGIAYRIKQQGEKALKEIQENTKKVIETLRENERELVKQVEERLEKAERNLNIIHHMPAVTEHMNRVMERGLASEMMDIQETECSEDYILNPISPYSRIVYIPNEALVQEVSAGVGEIQLYSKTDHTMSTIHVEPTEPRALSQGKVILTVSKTSAGEINYDPADVVDVKISPEDDVVMHKKSAGTADGEVEVEFMAKVAGQLTVEVQVNGNHVSNSPLVMNVHPQQMRRTRKFKMKVLRRLSANVNGIAVNKENSRIAVADESADCVHVFNTNGDFLLTYGSEGSGEGQLDDPEGLAFLNDTDLVIADNNNHRICIVNTTTGTVIKTFDKDHGSDDGKMYNPSGVHVDDNGNIMVCDSRYCVRVFTRDGQFQYQFGLTISNFSPFDIVAHDGRFYVSDDRNHVIHVFEKKNGVPTRVFTIGGEGSGDGLLNRPMGLAIDNDHHLLVCDHLNDRIQKFTLDGRLVGETFNKVDGPVYITVMNDGQVLMTSYNYGVYFVE